ADGWCYFDVRHEFPGAWQLFRDSSKHKEFARLPLRFERKRFPFIPGAHEITIDQMVILFPAHERCRCPEPEGCACPKSGKPSCRVIKFIRGEQDHDKDQDRDCGLSVSCYAVEEWPDLYCGVFDSHMGSLGRDGHGDVKFLFPRDLAEVPNIFLLCRYRRE